MRTILRSAAALAAIVLVFVTVGGCASTGGTIAFAMECVERGILAKYNVELIGASAEAIHKAEDRTAFKQTMIDIGFLDPASPKRLMQRMRRLFARARLEREEVNILRGILAAAQAAARRKT